MYIRSTTYTATRAVSRQFEYACTHCGARAAANVEATGTGESRGLLSNADNAALKANASAELNAHLGLTESPCPQCGRYQPLLETRYKAYADGIARAKRRRWPFAAVVGLVVLGLGIGPAIRDMETSSALLKTFLCASAAASCFAFAAFGAPPKRPVPPTARVQFWWGLPDGTVGWLPPPPVALPRLPSAPVAHFAGLLVGAHFAFGAILSLIAYSETFKSVYVVGGSANPIFLDGTNMTKDVVHRHPTDVEYREVSVRTGKDHHLELGGTSYALDPSAAYGWLIVPNALSEDRCFFEEEAVYGDTHDEPQFAELTPRDGIIVLPRHYDKLFVEPPKQVRMKRKEIRRDWYLRSRPCSEMADDEE